MLQLLIKFFFIILLIFCTTFEKGSEKTSLRTFQNFIPQVSGLYLPAGSHPDSFQKDSPGKSLSPGAACYAFQNRCINETIRIKPYML